MVIAILKDEYYALTNPDMILLIIAEAMRCSDQLWIHILREGSYDFAIPINNAIM